MSERLPDEGAVVWATDGREPVLLAMFGGRYVWMDHPYGDGNPWRDGNEPDVELAIEPTHWMPVDVPEPPPNHSETPNSSPPKEA